MVPKRRIITACMGLLSLLVLLKIFHIYVFLNPVVKIGPTASHRWSNEKSYANLMWMIQISDIHLSAYRDQSRMKNFYEFCNTTLDAIKPSVVLASGDITDGTSASGYLTYQVEDEWIFYREALNRNNVTKKVLWLDIRGNHDNFNVLRITSKENYFRQYGIQGSKNPHHYSTEYKMANGELVTFIAVDECLDVGIRRPFNFIGSMKDHDLKIIEEYSNASLIRNSSHVIWFGHYPTSTLLSKGRERLQKIIKSNGKTVAYLSGHLHTLGGLAPHMYAYQNGFFELELADWKFDRTFRIMALDNGQFAFTDVIYNKWPYVLVTHPKTALLASENDMSALSNINSVYPHIRLLVFSLANITEVSVEIDNTGVWQTCTHAEGPLFVLPWSASSYREGLHVMKIRVKDEDGRDEVATHQFSLDGTRIKFDLMSRILLMGNVYSVFQCIFLCMVIVSIFPFVLFRVLNLFASRKLLDWSLQTDHDYCGLRRFWILSNINILFYPLILYPIYLLIGPWYVSLDMIDNKLGVVFSWGIWVDGNYIPESPAYILGLFHLLAFHLPAVLLLASAIDKKSKKILHRKFIVTKKFTLLSICCDILFLIVCCFMFFELYLLWRMDGFFSVVLCPLQTWWLLLVVWLRQVIKTLPREAVLHAIKHWKKPDNADVPSSEALPVYNRQLTPLESA